MILSIDADYCSGCRLCDEACPTDVIHCDPKTGKAVIAHQRHCCTCFLCAIVCPTECIEIHPVLQKRPLPW